MAKNPTISASLAVLMVAAAAIFVAANAQSSPVAAPGLSPSLGPAPSPGGLDCFPYLLNVSDCLTYVEKGSNLTAPEKPCCPEVKTLLETQPICLCELLGHPDQSPVPLDLPRAIALPSVCKIKMPFGISNPTTACAALGVPVGAPAPAPGSSPTPSGTSLSPDGSPSATASPNNDGQRNGGSQRHLLFGLALVAFLSFF